MIELIVVIALMGILAAVGLARFVDRKAFDADAFVEQSRAMLRYGQKVAIAQNRPVYVRLDGASLALCFHAACGAGNRVRTAANTNSTGSATLAACNGDTTWACEAAPAGVSYTLTPAAPYAGTSNYFFYDALGKPFAAADSPTTSVSSSFAALTLTVVVDGVNRPIQVEQETGYVH